MGAVQTEIALCSRPWRGPFHIYVGLACNSLTAALSKYILFNLWSDRTPLHDAAYHGRLLILRTLVTQACLGGHCACTKFLLENGANVKMYSFTTHLVHHLSSPIHEAAKRGHRECLEGSHGAHIDLELPGVGTPLYTACLAQATDCVERPLQSGVDDQGGCGQDTSLHAAVQGGGVREVELLMDYGADGSCRNSDAEHTGRLLWSWQPRTLVRTTIQKRGPCTLSQLCRFCIRKSLGRTRLHRTSGLYLPYRFQAFLL
ncbi:hypothetical protein J4Q44_G00146240 [Coregonus suidteri]|uniref:Ankyrin repeat and SOCS box protein 11 n=1 Tax=Coregonus suidteri TaxID=861788 RepID=A0AAN8QSX5_9TELE